MKILPEGFKDSDIGPIPQDWEVKALGELGNWTAGVTPFRSNPHYYGGNIPWIKTGELTDGYIHDAAEYITELALSQLSLRLNPIGSILIAMYGATIGKLGILAKPMTTNQACCACIPLGNVNNTFIFYQLLANRGAIIKQAEGAAQPNISKEKILVFSIGVPPFHEQQAIAGALSDIDALISAQEELLAKKRAIKQGAMQELLTGRRRLPGFPIRPMKQTDIGPIPEDWEVKELGALCNLIKESGIPEPNGYCIELENIESNTGRLCGEVQKCIHATRFHYKADDVLYGRLRAYLQKYYYGRENGWCSTEIWVLRASDVASGFLRYLVASSRFAEAAAVTHGTHMPRSEWKVVEKTLFGIPSSISEQVAIAAVLSDMDAEITAVEEELAKHRALKRGMMQELLSGRIRLPYKKSTHKKQNAGE